MDTNKRIQDAMRDKTLLIGMESVTTAAKIGKIKAIIFATNLPSHFKRDVDHYAALGKIEVVPFDGDAIRLGQVCGKPFKILAVGIQ